MAKRRPGAPKKPEHLKHKPVLISIRSEVWEKARALGDGNVSAGFSKAIESYYSQQLTNDL